VSQQPQLTKKRKKKTLRYFEETEDKQSKKDTEAIVVVKPKIKTPKRLDRRKPRNLTEKPDKDGVVIVRPKMKAPKQNLERWKRRNFRDSDPYPGEAPIPKDRLDRYGHGAQKIKVPKRGLRGERLQQVKSRSIFAQKQAARAERLHDDEAGFLELDEAEKEARLSQTEIAAAVDVTSATKYFELQLSQFGPYGINYTRNGRHLLLGGQKGHVAAFDWQTKRLHCEFNAMETIHDVRWLHQETLFATAQKSGVYIYDNQGIELHALTGLDSVLSMEFLPHHFLLCTANSKGFLAYTDVTMGVKVAGICTGLGRLDVMCQNPSNAIVHLGHGWGTVTLWSPNVKEPLVKMLCHKSSVRSVAVDPTGMYMATSGVDRKLKVWDLRTYKTLANYQLSMGAGSLAFSQTGMLASATGSIVQTYKDVCREAIVTPYLSHLCRGTVREVQFCPFEDVLGAGHKSGFSSLIIPGAGEANMDAVEVNPMATKKQRQHAE
ncbi:hypothetical protein BaRGS_00029991, partial [Batillaria attramentaria]